MKISVVVPAYNAEAYIEATIRSILNQTWRDFELIVIDDCSRDRTVEIVSRLAEEDRRITLLKNEKNSGVSVSRNTGVSKAKGEWIAFLDSDDLWREDKLEKQLAFLESRQDAVLGYTASAFMDEDGSPYNYILEAEEVMTYRKLLRRNLITCSSVMVRREVMARHPMGGDQMHEDYSVWLQILRETQCAYGLNEPLLIYRLRKGSKSGSRLRSAKMIFRTYQYVGYSAPAAALLTIGYVPHSVLKRRRIWSSGKKAV